MVSGPLIALLLVMNPQLANAGCDESLRGGKVPRTLNAFLKAARAEGFWIKQGDKSEKLKSGGHSFVTHDPVGSPKHILVETPSILDRSTKGPGPNVVEALNFLLERAKFELRDTVLIQPYVTSRSGDDSIDFGMLVTRSFLLSKIFSQKPGPNGLDLSPLRGLPLAFDAEVEKAFSQSAYVQGKTGTSIEGWAQYAVNFGKQDGARPGPITTSLVLATRWNESETILWSETLMSLCLRANHLHRQVLETSGSKPLTAEQVQEAIILWPRMRELLQVLLTKN